MTDLQKKAHAIQQHCSKLNPHDYRSVCRVSCELYNAETEICMCFKSSDKDQKPIAPSQWTLSVKQVFSKLF